MALLGEDGQGLFDTRKLIAPTGYRTPESGQEEKTGVLQLAANTDFQTIRTVTTGKRYYISDILISNISTGNKLFTIGFSDTDVLVVWLLATSNYTLNLSVPIKATSGQTIQVKMDVSTGSVPWVTVSGWEE